MQTPANSKVTSKASSPAHINNITTEPPSSNSSSSNTTTTTIAPLDPYQNSRAHPADGSFRNALTTEECQAAEERLGAVCGLETLQRYLGDFPGSLGAGEPFNTTARYWYQNITTIEETRDRVTELDAKETRIEDVIRILQEELRLIRGDKRALEDYGRDAMKYVRHNLWQVKAAIKEAQRDLRKADERELREAARREGHKLPVLPPADSNPDVRNLTTEELSTRMAAQCTKCGQFGHWWNDHYSIKCGHCFTYAPGHSPNHCPNNPHQKPASVAAENGSQASSRQDTGSTEQGWGVSGNSGWGTWNPDEIDNAAWVKWQEKVRKEKKDGKKKPLGNGWDPIENNTEEHWLAPTEAEKRRNERKARRQTRFLLTPGDRKTLKATRLQPARRHRKPKGEEKEAGEWSCDDWEENFGDDAYTNMDF